jgi:hypothetical protein
MTVIDQGQRRPRGGEIAGPGVLQILGHFQFGWEKKSLMLYMERVDDDGWGQGKGWRDSKKGGDEESNSSNH